MNTKELDLGAEDIGQLIRKFSVPCVISMIVAALYNIVDQIFIGWSAAGAYGNAATNIVYPFTVLALGLALLAGDGAAAGFSLSSGEGDTARANRSVGNGLLVLLIFSVVLCGLGFLLKENILQLFGGDPKETECYGYAVDYYTVICAGLPFYMIGQGLNGTIRADGSPAYAMACTLAGAIANLILDPLFIFTFGMGVRGAAIATVVGQMLTFGMSIAYLSKSKLFKINKEALRPDRQALGRIFGLGMASLIVQFSIVVIIAVNNNLLAKYGYGTQASTGNVYGAVIPLAVTGIVMKVFGIVISIAIGISLGGQPIIGYNLGAGKTERVKQTIKRLTAAVLIVGLAALLLFELAPDAVISLFGNSNSPEYLEYARLCIRIFLSGIVLTCYIKSSSIVLQAMGSSAKSTLLALMRDVIVFVPATIIIASLSHNIVTMLWAALISDVTAAVAGFFFVRTEIRKAEERCGK